MYGYIMLRTQIMLTEENRAALDAAAQSTGRSVSALIREAVTCTFGDTRDAGTDIAAIEAAAGSWAPRTGDGAALVEEMRSGERLHQAVSGPIGMKKL
jgi:predicted DNA-binding protein